jgi:hypothetical protein
LLAKTADPCTTANCGATPGTGDGGIVPNPDAGPGKKPIKKPTNISANPAEKALVKEPVGKPVKKIVRAPADTQTSPQK